MGIVNLIASIISNVSDDQVFSEAIKLAIGVTVGGNIKGQETFYKTFSEGYSTKFKYKDTKNNEGLRVLQTIKARLDKAFENIRKIYELKNDLIIKFSHIDQANQTEDYKKTLKKYDSQALNSVKVAKRIFRFLQLLCEGHNSKLQNYLRQQFQEEDPFFSMNINFVNYAAMTLGSFVKYVNPSLIDLGSRIFDFLIEVIQGPCTANQSALFDAKIVDYCKDLMNEFVTDKDYKVKGFEEHRSEIDSMIKWSIKLLYTLLEANRDREIIEYIAFNVEFEYLMKVLTNEFVEMFSEIEQLTEQNLAEWSIEKLNKKLMVSLFDEDSSETFDIFFLIKTLNNQTGRYSNDISKLTGLQKNAFDFYSFHTGQLELVFRDNELYNQYFIIQPACRYYEDSDKDDLMVNLNRDSAKEQVTDFLSYAPKIFDTIEHLSKLLKDQKFYTPSIKLYKQLRLLSLFIAIIINILILCFFKKKLEKGASVNDPYFDSGHIVMRALGGLHTFIGLILIWVWSKAKSPMVRIDES